MQINIYGYQIETVKQALQDADTLWEARIEQAESGDRQNLSIEGARMMQNDLRNVLDQIIQVENRVWFSSIFPLN